MRRILLVLVLAFACGDDDTDPGDCPAPPAPSDGAPYQSAADFDRFGCSPGSLAGLDPVGLYYTELTIQGMPAGGGSFRIAEGCAGLEATTGYGPAPVTASDDDLFWRSELSADDGSRYVQAWDLCGRDDDGRLIGHGVDCYLFPGEPEDSCFVYDVVAGPLGRLPGESEGDGLSLVSEFAGEPAWAEAFYTVNVRVVDGIAYLVRIGDGLRIVDVADPARPRDLGAYTDPDEYYNDVKIVDGPDGKRYALIAAAEGMLVVDVTDPTAPQLADAYLDNGGIHTLFTETVDGQTRAYLAGGAEALAIVDVTDPERPERIGGYLADWRSHDLYVEGGRAYVEGEFAGLFVLDTLAAPAEPTVLGNYPTTGYAHSNWVTSAGGRTIAVHGDEGHGAHVEIIDVDPSSQEFMTRIGSFETRPYVSVHNIMAFGDRAYLSHYQDGIRVLDLSRPTAPRQVAYYNTWNPDTASGQFFDGAVGIDVDLEAGLIYVADTPRGLIILRLEE